MYLLCVSWHFPALGRACRNCLWSWYFTDPGRGIGYSFQLAITAPLYSITGYCIAPAQGITCQWGHSLFSKCEYSFVVLPQARGHSPCYCGPWREANCFVLASHIKDHLAEGGCPSSATLHCSQCWLPSFGHTLKPKTRSFWAECLNIEALPLDWIEAFASRWRHQGGVQMYPSHLRIYTEVMQRSVIDMSARHVAICSCFKTILE